MANQTLPVKTITFCAYKALNRIMGFAPSNQLLWMEQVGMDWMDDVAPHDNYGRIVSHWIDIDPSQDVYEIPKSVIRVTTIGMQSQGKFYTLTVDPNIAMPESFTFNCDPIGGSMDSFTPYGGGYAPFRASLPYNTNYYRIQNGLIKFMPAPLQGHLYIETFESGGYSGDTIVHAGYVDALRLYMTWQYYENKCSGSADDNTNDFYKWRSLAKDFERQYNETMRLSNTVVKCPKIGDIMDAVSGWG
jgi:hypothetical protein